MILNKIKLNNELTAIKASLVTSDSAKVKAEADLKEAQSIIDALKVEKETADKTIKELQGKLDATTKEKAEVIVTATKEVEEKVAAVKVEAEAKIVATEASVNAKVNTELANIGVEASSIKISQEVLPTKEEVIKKLRDLGNTKEAQAYYAKYKAVAWSK